MDDPTRVAVYHNDKRHTIPTYSTASGETRINLLSRVHLVCMCKDLHHSESLLFIFLRRCICTPNTKCLRVWVVLIIMTDVMVRPWWTTRHRNQRRRIGPVHHACMHCYIWELSSYPSLYPHACEAEPPSALDWVLISVGIGLLICIVLKIWNYFWFKFRVTECSLRKGLIRLHLDGMMTRTCLSFGNRHRSLSMRGQSISGIWPQQFCSSS